LLSANEVENTLARGGKRNGTTAEGVVKKGINPEIGWKLICPDLRMDIKKIRYNNNLLSVTYVFLGIA